jgi:hypothetical protein
MPNHNVNMALSNEQLEQFRDLYRKRYGKEISKECAIDQAMKLLCILRRIYTPMTKKRFEEIQKYRAGILPDIIAKVASLDNGI